MKTNQIKRAKKKLCGGETTLREHLARAGSSRSRAKTAAAKANGRLGGRPKKSTPNPTQP